jgi:predicted RNase H-like HicB family nuclease
MITKAKEGARVSILKFTVLINVDEDTPGFHAYAPSLKGLHMGGDTEKEARDNAREAAVLYIKSLLKHGDPIPIDIIQPDSEKKMPVLEKHISSQIEEIQVKL